MKKLLTWLGLSVVAIAGVSALASGSHSTVSTESRVESTPTQIQNAPKIETKEETKEEVVAFNSKTVNDSSLAKGQTKTTQQGVNGKITHYFNVTYTGGIETGRTETKTTRVDPVDQITALGTYVTPAKPQHPAGASAICRDGTYSYSQNRQGTCSHHGGVAQWL